MTTTSHQPTRRDLLKWFSGIPFLPLGAMATTAALTGCNNSDSDAITIPPTKPVNFKSAKFTPMTAPSTVSDMATTSVKSKLQITWDDATNTEYQLAYKPFFVTGQTVPKHGGGTIVAGGYFDVNGNPIMDKSVVGQERQFFSDAPDGSSLIHLDGAKVEGVTTPVFHVVQFEYNSKDQSGADTYGQLPSPIAILTLDQDQKTGHLELKKYFNVNTAPVHGLWITCGASLSPWNTHLSSEEYEPDAFNQGIGGADPAGFGKYFFNNDMSKVKPYNYGHLPEVIVNLDGTGSIKKHYCLGRISHELVQVMPDNKTVIMGDDYTNGGFFMFIADKEKDLSAGTLYAAKYKDELNETSTARIEWIKLGSATSKEIEDLVNVQNIQPTDIMESLNVNPNDASYTEITLAKKKLWVKLKPGMEKAAAFLETHRYAALMGASMAFTKMEGTTVNIKDKVAYSALANIQDSMVVTGKGYVAAHNVKFAKALKAGGVLAHDLKSSQVDSNATLIKSEWVPAQSHMLLMGKDINFDNLGNTADPEQIASPDNLKFSEKLRTLFIGEDSGNHLNNFLWAYNVDTNTLDRILSTPAGAESTGLHAVDEVNGWTYIMSNFQHPGDEWNRFYKIDATTGARSGLSADLLTQIDTAIDANYNKKFAAAVGYITADPIAPSMQKKATPSK
ncbi:alkaline phosphatase PhoX [Acinetobacter sp. NS-4]|uniref:PhoX family protein n=1 Tax=Acinetobacter sp. NS-4 TaxID=3127956 RepID=UPI00307D43E8